MTQSTLKNPGIIPSKSSKNVLSKQVAKRQITLNTSRPQHSRKFSQTSQTSITGTTNSVATSKALAKQGSTLNAKKTLSMQSTVNQPIKQPSDPPLVESYSNKNDGKRMIKQIISENLKRSKSKKASIDANSIGITTL